MKKQISEREIVKRVCGYKKRMRSHDVPSYPFNQKGAYAIYSGSIGDYGTRKFLEVVNGRFIDAIAYASQLNGFCGDWCTWELPENCNHGYLEKLDITQAEKLDCLDKLLEGVQ
jgi:hypothetical protein